jgi:anti-sigma regulatory factor (Ser/Thr protein kinase)
VSTRIPALELFLGDESEERRRLHDALEVFGRRHRVEPRIISHLQLALEEHLANLAAHVGRPAGGLRVELRLFPTAAGIEIEVEDNGAAFNPLEHPEVDTQKPLEERAIGGLGIHLIRRLTDKLEYRRMGDRNWLRITKRW